MASTASGRPSYLLEKDVWVVWALNVLFASQFGSDLVFKGGTSLSKAHKAIRRFSEDIDITYDIRKLIPDLIGSEGPVPSTRSKGQKWTKAVRERLPAWVAGMVLPIIEERLRAIGVSAKVWTDGEKILISYERLFDGPPYVSPRVEIEFGARSTGEPCAEHSIVCDAAEYVPALTFPTATPKVMVVGRTFWEKATAAHVFCHQGKLPAGRFARHWHDLAQLDASGHAAPALADRKLAKEVAKHKGIFFIENDHLGQRIDYTAAVSGSLKLIPADAAYTALNADYDIMVKAGLLVTEDAYPFDDLMERCRALERRANEHV